MVYPIYQKTKLQMEKSIYSNLNLLICIRTDQNNGILKDKCFGGNQKVIISASRLWNKCNNPKIHWTIVYFIFWAPYVNFSEQLVNPTWSSLSRSIKSKTKTSYEGTFATNYCILYMKSYVRTYFPLVFFSHTMQQDLPYH